MVRWAALPPALAAVVLAAGLAAPPVAAFDAGSGGPHDVITAAAARESGMPEEMVVALQEAVRDVDLRDGVTEPLTEGPVGVPRHGVAGSYLPEHHCDRATGSGHLESFNATVAFVQDTGAAAVEAGRAGDPEGAMRLLGDLLHAVQDCFGHSNAVDLADPSVVVQSVNGHADAPAGLRLTGALVDPDARLADGHTKAEAARGLAIEASILALQDILARLDPAEVQALADALAPGGQPIPRVGVPAPAWSLVVAGLMAVAVFMRRR